MDDSNDAAIRDVRDGLVPRRRVLMALGIAAAAVPLAAVPGGLPGTAPAAAAAEPAATPPYDAIVGLI
jgi:hypothetical protein